jgi:hypothetical protein
MVHVVEAPVDEKDQIKLYSRRTFGMALAALPAVALFEKSFAGSALLQAKPNSYTRRAA